MTAMAALSAERLAVAAEDGLVRLFRVLDGSCAALVRAGVPGCGGVPALASLRDGRLVTAAGAAVAVWRELAGDDGGPQTELRGHARAVTCLAVVAQPSASIVPEKPRICGFERIC